MDDRNELFGDDFDDFDDMFDDDNGGGDFQFDDDDDFIGDIDKLDFDDDNVIGDDDEGGGPSRTFVLLAAMMIIVFILALVAVIFLSRGRDELDPFDATATFIVQLNATTEAEINLQNTREAVAAATQVAIQVTESVQMTQAAQTAIAEQTAQARQEQIQQTQQAINATSTAVAQSSQSELQATADAQATANAQATQLAGEVETTPEPITLLDAQLTATALAEIYLGLTPTGNETPTREVSGPVDAGTGGPTVVTRPGQLPETGFMDENLSLLVLAAFGLLGVIFASRRLRSLNSSS